MKKNESLILTILYNHDYLKQSFMPEEIISITQEYKNILGFYLMENVLNGQYSIDAYCEFSIKSYPLIINFKSNAILISYKYKRSEAIELLTNLLELYGEIERFFRNQ